MTSKKKAILFFWLFVGGAACWWLFDSYVFQRPVGEACTANSDCRGFSGACLSLKPARRSVLGMTPTRKPGEMGVCTQPCESDADCPSPMRCGLTARYHVYRGSSVSFDAPDSQKMCVLPLQREDGDEDE